MALLDRLQDGFDRIMPSKTPSRLPAGGIGSGHGAVNFDDDMIVPKSAIIFFTLQIFFSFLAMCCFAGVASFQAKWGVGPSGLSGFAIFVAVSGIFLSFFLLLVPVIYEKYDKFPQLARTLKEVRVSFILTGTGTLFFLLVAFITTISAFTQPGCKNASKDPNAKSKGSGFVNGLPGWCSTKKAGSIFFWLAFIFWGCQLFFLFRTWRSGEMRSGLPRPRDPPFTHPPSVHTAADDEEEGDADGDGDEESTYRQIPPPRLGDPFSPSFTDNPSRPTAGRNGTPPISPFADPRAAVPVGRPSMDAYGAFSDPPPNGFDAVSSPTTSEPPRVSRTMQYADPYAAVRATINTAAASGAPQAAGPTSPGPPSYESYQFR